MPVVGFINSASPGGYAFLRDAFRQGLKETGYVEGQNVAVEYRWAEGQYDRQLVMALELVSRRQVAVIVANSPGALAIKAGIKTIPIVFTTASDPVLDSTRMWRSTERASLEKKPSMRLSQEPCLGVAPASHWRVLSALRAALIEPVSRAKETAPFPGRSSS
jgi:hypothetical protein